MRRTFLLLALLFFLFQGFAQKDVKVKHLSDHLAKIASLTHKQAIVTPKSHTYYRLDTFGMDVNYTGYINGTLQPYIRTIYSYDNDNYTTDILSKQYDLNSHNFVDVQEVIYTRDANHNIIEEIGKSGYGNLQNDYRYLYVYDANNNQIVKTYQEYNNGNWLNRTLDSSYYYNDNYVDLSIHYTWNSSSNNWSPGVKREYFYDSFNNNILTKSYFYDGTNWNNLGLDSFYYQNGYLMHHVSYYWDNGAWTFDRGKNYTYDIHGNLISEVDYTLNDTTYMEHNYYNAQNLLIKDTVWELDYDSGLLLYSYNDVYLYDSDNSPIGIVSQTWDTTSNQWVNDQSITINYNTNVNFSDAIYPEDMQDFFEGIPMIYMPTSALIKQWRGDSSTWMNAMEFLFKYKTIVTSIGNAANSQQITLYPNPASNVIHINLPEEQKSLVVIYDENGRVVRTTKLVTGQVSVKSLPTGTYFVVIRGKNQIYVGKFLKR